MKRHSKATISILFITSAIAILLLVPIRQRKDTGQHKDTVYAQASSDVSIDAFLQDTPRSTCFKQVGYDAQNQTLYLVFRTTGAMYRYTGFPQDAWDSLINDSSLGGHFNRQIKGKYSYIRVR